MPFCGQAALTRFFAAVLLVFLMALLFAPNSLARGKTIRFADGNWDSIRLQNRIAGFILEKGLGFKARYVETEPGKILEGLCRGKVDVVMEMWGEQSRDYDSCLNEYKAVDLGPSLPDNWQGWLVPRYMVEGDPDRGVPPVAPGLATVYDMALFWKFFTTKKSPDQGIFYGGVPGWGASVINGQKLKAYGLDPWYDLFLPDSEKDLAASLEKAYAAKRPWIGYYWAPTWVLGKYDMVPLAEPPFDPETWDTTRACAYPRARVNVLVRMDLFKKAPRAVAMLVPYEVSIESISETLAWVHESQDDSPEAGALWFLKHYKDIWKTWVPPRVAEKVDKALK